MRLRSYPVSLLVNSNRLSAVDDPSTQRSRRLVAREQNVRFPPLDVVSEVMEDPTAVAHAAPGDDDGAAVQAVYDPGFLSGFGQMQVSECRHFQQVAAHDGVARGVHVDRKRRKRLLAGADEVVFDPLAVALARLVV